MKFRRFWVEKQPHHSENVSAKKLYTFIVARTITEPHRTPPYTESARRFPFYAVKKLGIRRIMIIVVLVPLFFIFDDLLLHSHITHLV